MELFYNGTAFHGVGKLRVGGMTETMMPEGESPRRMKRVLKVTLDFTEEDYVGNRAKVDLMRAAVRPGNGVLKWWDEAGGTKWVEQAATVTSAGWPDDPNQWGTYHQVVEFAFEFFGNLDGPEGGWFEADYRKSSSVLDPVSLGHTHLWREGKSYSRVSALRSQRSGGSGKVSASGQFLANPAEDYETRAAALLAAKAALDAELAEKDGELRYFRPNGLTAQMAFSKTVRVEEWDCQVNQAVTALDWSLTAGWSEFPDEAGYAMAEFEVKTREDAESGQVILTLSGKIGAQSAAAAQAKLVLLRAAYVPAPSGGAGYALMRKDASERNVAMDIDGESFLELSFDEEYRKSAGAILNWDLRVSDSEELKSGMVRRTYAGSVTGQSNASWDAAYQAAVAKARALGDGKHQFKTGSAITADDAQTSSDRITTLPTLFCRVDFSFEYELKSDRVWIEATAETAEDTFGRDTESVSGSVVARSFAIAQGYVNTMLAGYSDRLILNKRTSQVKHQTPLASGNSGAVSSPPRLTGGSVTTINSGETNDGTLAAQEVRVEFSFSVHKSKTDIAIKYGLEVENDYTALKTMTTVSGTVSARNAEEAQLGLAQLMTTLAVAGVKLRERTGESREQFYGDGTKDIQAFLTFDFSQSFERALTGTALIVRCEVSEEIKHSGIRWVAQPTAAGRVVVQGCGYDAGARLVRAEALAATAGAAEDWVRRQFELPYGGTEPGARYGKPPVFERSAGFLSLTDGVWRDGTFGGVDMESNVLMQRVSGTFEEILPDYDYQP